MLYENLICLGSSSEIPVTVEEDEAMVELYKEITIELDGEKLGEFISEAINAKPKVTYLGKTRVWALGRCPYQLEYVKYMDGLIGVGLPMNELTFVDSGWSVEL